MLNPPNHIYDEGRVETLCGQSNTQDMLGINCVCRKGTELWWKIRGTRSWRNDPEPEVVTLGDGHLYILTTIQTAEYLPDRRHLCHVCSECYSLYVLSAA